MPVFIKNIQNRFTIEFDKGIFDDWCVYITSNNGVRYAPKDKEYFLRLQVLATVHGAERIYLDFVKYYERTTNIIQQDVLDLIVLLASGYAPDTEEVELWFTVIYAGMVAEENKAHAILKKRMKRLGLYQLLIEEKDADYAAVFSKGKSWKHLDGLMKERGF